jgi:F420-non-reducing hydrogenase large subunit
MKHSTIFIDPVTRIEGHASVRIDLDKEGNVISAKFSVNELRGIEKILEGTKVLEAPSITARICGVCPAAHHLVSAKTLDRIYDIEPTDAAKIIRELMYMGHIIHSHTMSLFFLSGPDLFMGLDAEPEIRNIVGMSKQYREIVNMAVELRSLGQKILEHLGARGVHPVTATVGGVSFVMDANLREKILEYTNRALQLTLDFATPLIKEKLFELMNKYPDIHKHTELKTHYVGTVNNGKLNFYEGMIRVMDTEGNITCEFDSNEYDKYIIEEAVKWSYSKPTFLKTTHGKVIYRVNTLARINVADEMETPKANQELEVFRKKYGRPCHYTLMHHYARLIELIYACEKAIFLIKDDRIMGESRKIVKKSPKNAIAHIEAPRGTLIHDYTVNENGVIEKANLIIATQQNFFAINETIKQCATYFLKNSPDSLMNAVEFLIRTYDPCLSCSTHAYGKSPFFIDIYQNNKLLKRIQD